MKNDHHIWRVWASTLHRWGWEGVVAALLEATGPFNWVVSQVVYVGQPFLSMLFPVDHLEALARMLEDDGETEHFVALLRGGI